MRSSASILFQSEIVVLSHETGYYSILPTENDGSGRTLWWVSLPFIANATVEIDKTTYIPRKPFVSGAADQAKHIIFNALPYHCDVHNLHTTSTRQEQQHC